MISKKVFFLFIAVITISFTRANATSVDSVLYNGLWRNYRLFTPSGFNTITQHSLVFNLHGYGSNALEQEIYSGFNVIADTANVVVCYPNGLNNSWNAFDRSPDDVGFIDTLITLLHDKYNINLNRVYSTGMSNGGFMSNYLACELSQRFAAIAPVAGTNSILVQANCSPSRHVPVLYIHGTADGTVSYDGSSVFVSAAELMELWSNSNGCSTYTDTILLADIILLDHCRAEKVTWHDCDSNKQVIHYRIIEGGHTWPGSPYIIGITNQDFYASGVIWNFFNKFSLNPDNDISDFRGNNVIITQNVFTSFIDIELPTSSKSIINIYSPDGRLMQSSEHYESKIHLEEEQLAQGLFFLNVLQNNTSKTIRIIKII